MTQPLQNADQKPGEDDRMWEKVKACPHFYDLLELMPEAKGLLCQAPNLEMESVLKDIEDDLLYDAGALICCTNKASITILQREFNIGFN